MANQAAYYRLKRARPVVTKFELTYPIMVAGEEVDELWFTRLCLGDLDGTAFPQLIHAFQQASSGEGDLDLSMLPRDLTETLQRLVACSAGISVDEARSIDAGDAFTLMEAVVPFLTPSERSARSGGAP